jgi:hypothetical protein
MIGITEEPVVTGCDNMGLVLRLRTPNGPLPERQPQADVIRTIQTTLSQVPFRVDYHHVYGHQDSTQTFESLPLLNQLNVMADNLAKTASEDAIANSCYISSDWPLE